MLSRLHYYKITVSADRKRNMQNYEHSTEQNGGLTMYARVLNAEEKRSITQIHKTIEKPGFKLSDKAKQKLMGILHRLQ